MGYYTDKIEVLKNIFGTENVNLSSEGLLVDKHFYPIVDDVIVLLDPIQYTEHLKKRLKITTDKINNKSSEFAEDIQFTFGEEWQKFSRILPEHKQEFLQYFDLIDLNSIKNKRVCDLGCGIGRWSYFLRDKCKELVLVDFSESIFIARNNLKDSNALFFMCDIKKLPFRDSFADLIFCLGVLHHLPTDALDEVKNLKKYSPLLLIYLYYALDNRPIHFRILFFHVTILRKLVSRIRNPLFRSIFTWFTTITGYLPMIELGKILKPIGLSKHIPLYESYNKNTIKRIKQDVYDRFFTNIEQRLSRNQIAALNKEFSTVIISDNLPYWHFLCER
ncbi:MAG: class I SAM-dependent methyltransferase [Deltaproteobacteria bacterium]|nr:class I SAM-dependent methyltransferase [Deltaproteobacteria bacterium]MCL5791428.1 class I SAM-dependent methyltransferase [Deltaproteobacteria bacterium]